MEPIEILETNEFRHWFEGLRDPVGRYRVLARLRRLSLGHLGDFKVGGDGVLELRVDHGPGYRIYFVRRGHRPVVLLLGGDKSSQIRDIDRAQKLARGL